MGFIRFLCVVGPTARDTEKSGYYPQGSLVQDSDGNLYGTTQYGGQYCSGTVFKIAADGTFSLLHAFNYSDGVYPQGSLVQDSDGNLYGTTQNFGPSFSGTIFKISSTGIFDTLFS